MKGARTRNIKKRKTMFKDDLSYGLFLSDRQLDFLSNYPQGFDRMKCFATFLHLAVKEPTYYEKKEYSVGLTPGQFAISEVELAKLWKCNRKTASKMVDMFHEVGLVSSIPNCRTTVFTVHCVASWYIGNEVIRNEHYSRHPQVEQRIKANHKRTDAVVGNEGNSREKELFNDGVASTSQIEETLSSSITLTDAIFGSDSPENEAQPSSGLPDENNTDATTTAPAKTISDDAV
jgi:hypothetical protein